jgi:hypothetical protein
MVSWTSPELDRRIRLLGSEREVGQGVDDLVGLEVLEKNLANWRPTETTVTAGLQCGLTRAATSLLEYVSTPSTSLEPDPEPELEPEPECDPGLMDEVNSMRKRSGWVGQ